MSGRLSRRLRAAAKAAWAGFLEARRAESPPPTILWIVEGVTFDCKLHPAACPFCGERCLVSLPPPVRAIQPDKTNVVCHPLFGGCNHGFEWSPPAPN